ncbi:MAG: ribosomal protein N(5)-glutamine methyltransferase [Gammaproteobacteria bacterium]|jgi:ribosomal protein L3 glutamine methyltransferase|nr:ribosomal protein N(5)-glutamine methyltransferase [Gammaproteobacteria bacterium]
MTSITFQPAVEQLRTFRDMIRWGASQFNAAGLHFGHGIDNAWDEAVFLARHALHLSPAEDDVRIADVRLLASEREDIARLFAERIRTRKPAPYLTQEAWFAGLPFYVDERVIVPRSPIAELVERTFSPWLDKVEVSHILDLCTGSGCIAIACAVYFPEAQVDAVDISSDALAVAQKNIEDHDLLERVRLIESDVFSNVPAGQYDLIVSNPPYVDAEEMANLPPEYRQEPELALRAGGDGLDIAVRIIEKAADYLSDHGVLVMEVGSSAPALEARFPDLPLLWLTFEHGGHGVFVVNKAQLEEMRACL